MQSNTTDEVSKRTLEILESFNSKFESIQKELYNQKILIKALSDKILPGYATPASNSRSNRLDPLRMGEKLQSQRLNDRDIDGILKDFED